MQPTSTRKNAAGLRFLGGSLLSPHLHPSEHLTFRLQPLVGVVLQHRLGELPGHGLDNVLGLTGLEQVRDDRVAQVVEPEAGQMGRVPQRSPNAVPLLRRLRRVVVVVLARAPEIVLWVRVGEVVRVLSIRVMASRAAPFSGILHSLVSFLQCST